MDHPRSGHDDISNVVAGVLTTAADDTPRIIAFYIQENALLRRRADEAALEESELVSLRCPRDVTAAYGRSGVCYRADEQRHIRVRPDDAKALTLSGFKRIEVEGVEAA